MKLIKPSFEILEQAPGLEGLFQHIELCGKVCYKSEDKITKNSGKVFVERLITSEHLSVLEHGTVYLRMHWTYEIRNLYREVEKFFSYDPYSILNRVPNETADLCPTLYITTNLRVLVEKFSEVDREQIMEYMVNPTEKHKKRISVRFICDRGVSHEFVRHELCVA